MNCGKRVARPRKKRSNCNKKCSEEEERYRLMRDELIDCEADLNKKENLIAKIKVCIFHFITGLHFYKIFYFRVVLP